MDLFGDVCIDLPIKTDKIENFQYNATSKYISLCQLSLPGKTWTIYEKPFINLLFLLDNLTGYSCISVPAYTCMLVFFSNLKRTISVCECCVAFSVRNVN